MAKLPPKAGKGVCGSVAGSLDEGAGEGEGENEKGALFP